MKDSCHAVTRMRAEDADQFITLVRMHLSFVLDLNSDDCEVNTDRKCRHLKWNGLFSKKPKGNAKCTDGFHLPHDLVKQMKILIQFLRKPESIVQEGIFRRTGKLKRQQDLKIRLESNEIVDLDCGDYSVHDCASVLKTYLSELPEPLLTEAHYPAYCQISQLNGNEEKFLLVLQLLLLLLPVDNLEFLKDVLSLLHLVSLHCGTNRMSASNLATLFTPHLLWPRQLTAEALQANSQALSRVVAFMIEQCDKLFLVPDALATDVCAYWEKKERRQLLNESFCDGTTASTVFTFVDRERTAQENVSNPTELALAQLYAHIQSLPDSARKRRLVKNFNKKNGQGTPAVRNEHRRSRSLRESIKKHLSGFGKHGKPAEVTSPYSNDSMSPEPLMKTPLLPVSSLKIRRERLALKTELKTDTNQAKENRDPHAKVNHGASCSTRSLSKPQKRSPTVNSEDLPSKRTPPMLTVSPITTSTSSTLVLPTKKPNKETSEHSTALVPINMQPSPSLELIFTPPMADTKLSPLGVTLRSRTAGARTKKMSMSVEPRTCSPRFHTPKSVSNPRTKDYGLPCVSNSIPSSTPQQRRFACILTTSTPATRTPAITPQHAAQRNSSMSPITRSAQRMPRAMQETMMTPRSRKPVVSLSGSDLCQLTSLEPWTPIDADKRLILEESEESNKDSLSSTFRDYLISRSVLTASPVDLSFSSRTDDYQSQSSKSSSLDELPCVNKSPWLDHDKMSESLLYFLDGNDPDRASHVCETAI